MKKALLIVAAAMFIITGCQKEDPGQKSKSNNIIHIGVEQIGSVTKVAANDLAANPLTFHWEEGDKVIFWDYNEPITYTCIDPEKGTFSGQGLDPEGYYDLFTEYCFYAGSFLESHYRNNQIPKEHCIKNPDYSSGNSTTYTLYQHFTMLHIKLKGNAEIGKIEYKSKDNDVSARLLCDPAVQLSDTPIDFYFDINDLGYDGFTLYFYDSEGNQIGEKETSFNTSANKGKMIDFNEPLVINVPAE